MTGNTTTPINETQRLEIQALLAETYREVFKLKELNKTHIQDINDLINEDFLQLGYDTLQ